MELERSLPPLVDDALTRIVSRLLDLEPEAAGVIVIGSYAKGTAGASSDLDLVAVTPKPRVRYRMWFDGDLHVSAAAKTAEEWLERRRAPAGWSRSLGFPVTIDAAYLVAEPATRARLGDPPAYVHPPGEPELEDFVENVLKTRRAGDHPHACWHAQAAAMLAPRLLLDLNEVPLVRDRDDALDAALGLEIAPVRWRENLAVALGVAAGDPPAAALRLARGLLPFLREHAPDVDPQPDIGAYLRDGTLERLFER